jgi:hypothetical protein
LRRAGFTGAVTFAFITGKSHIYASDESLSLGTLLTSIAHSAVRE